MDRNAQAREYVLLALRCDRLAAGLVDAFTGAPALRRQVADEPRPTAEALAAQAARLRADVTSSPAAPARADFLNRQLIALECMLRRMAGGTPRFRDELCAYFDTEVEPGNQDRYREAHAELAAILPGGGPLAARMTAYRKAEELPADRLGPAIQALSGELRELTRQRIELPVEEAVYYEVSADRPWSAFSHHLSGCHSRVVINSEAGRRLSQLPHLVAHEAYPGHHTERSRSQLVATDQEERPERRVFLVNTPQCLISEGLADLGLTAAVGPAWGRWTAGVLAPLGIRWDGELAERVERAMVELLPVRQDAALLLHEGHAGVDEVVEFLRRWLLVPEPRARQMLRFLSHPLWRGYTTTYVEGYRLLRPWLDARPAGQHALDRVRRLLDEPLTPTALRDELGRAVAAQESPGMKQM